MQKGHRECNNLQLGIGHYTVEWLPAETGIVLGYLCSRAQTRVWASTMLIFTGLAMDGMTSRALVTRPYDTSTPELMVTTL